MPRRRARARRDAREVAAVEAARGPAIGLTSPEIARRVVVLPAPFGPEQGDDLAGRDLELDVADHGGAVVAGGQALDDENGLSHVRASAAASEQLGSAALPR